METLARQISDKLPNNSLICSMIDCKNDNCYYALYKKTDDDILDVLIEPQAETVEATLYIINTYIEDSNETGNIYFTGDATTKYKNDIEKTRAV